VTRPPVLDGRGIRVAAVSVVLGGAGLALAGTVAALTHRQWDQAPAFVVVAIVLALTARLVWRQVRWVVLVCLVAFAGQILAIIGTVWELTHAIAPSKAAQLQAIGINPTAAVTINLIYSTAAFAVFCRYAAHRWAKRRQSQPRQQPL
jgi:hypothetical protein